MSEHPSHLVLPGEEVTSRKLGLAGSLFSAGEGLDVLAANVVARWVDDEDFVAELSHRHLVWDSHPAKMVSLRENRLQRRDDCAEHEGCEFALGDEVRDLGLILDDELVTPWEYDAVDQTGAGHRGAGLKPAEGELANELLGVLAGLGKDGNEGLVDLGSADPRDEAEGVLLAVMWLPGFEAVQHCEIHPLVDRFEEGGFERGVDGSGASGGMRGDGSCRVGVAEERVVAEVVEDFRGDLGVQRVE